MATEVGTFVVAVVALGRYGLLFTGPDMDTITTLFHQCLASKLFQYQCHASSPMSSQASPIQVLECACIQHGTANCRYW